MTIQIDGLGTRTIPKDENEVLWFLQQKVKGMGEAARTNYLLAFKEKHFDQIQTAFRIQHFLQCFISEKQEVNREKRKNARLVKNEVELLGFIAKHKEDKRRRTFYLYNN